MRIVDKEGNTIENPDYSKGYLIEDSIIVKRHDSVSELKESGHYETIKTYPNGGKDVRYVIDTPGRSAQAPWNEYEEVLRYVEYTESELIDNRIFEHKRQLFDTDYHILKVVEGALSLKDCADVIASRASWRKEINELEARKMELVNDK